VEPRGNAGRDQVTVEAPDAIGYCLVSTALMKTPERSQLHDLLTVIPSAASL
jgi:hypothetical protein